MLRSPLPFADIQSEVPASARPNPALPSTPLLSYRAPTGRVLRTPNRFHTGTSSSHEHWTIVSAELYFVWCLGFSFALIAADNSDVLLARLQQRSVVSLRLPSGSEQDNFVSRVRATIVDAFGAKAVYEFNVTVRSHRCPLFQTRSTFILIFVMLVQVQPVPVAEFAQQLNENDFAGSSIGQQLAEAKGSGDSESFAPLLISTVQLLEARSNASANSSNNPTQDAAENQEMRKVLLQSVQTISENMFVTVDAMVQQVQWVTQLASNPKELNSDFRQVRLAR